MSSLLQWDQETGMPTSANPWRSEQIAFLAGKTHELTVAPCVGEWLEEAAATAEEPHDQADLREWKKEHQRAMRLPQAFVESCARAQALAHAAWVEAREKSDFSIFAPHLRTLVEQAREKAARWDDSKAPYDVLLDSYENGLTSDTARAVFDDIRSWLTPLAAEAEEICQSRATSLPAAEFSSHAQRELNLMAAKWTGFDFDSGRLDTTVHPFCTTIGPHDVRLTTRYDLADFTSSLYGVLHETGHGLYEQGLPVARYGTPCGTAVSLGVHESQSRLWENHIGRSRQFCQLILSWWSEVFPGTQSPDAALLWRHVNRVKRSFIRVEADEFTYDLHVALRFEIEEGLISGGLSVDEVPDAWNRLFKKLFDLQPANDRVGCLQDIHWSMGGFGYFPTYTLGNVYSARLMAAFSRQVGPFQGKPEILLGWLRENVHQHGSRFLPAELIERAAPDTSVADYRTYLENKLKELKQS